MRVRHVVLDRDGVLNQEAPAAGYIGTPEEFRWLPGSLEALGTLHRCGVRISVATNQSAVGRGLMSLPQLEAVHARMRADAEHHGAHFDAIVFCPHAPAAGCACRKPASGLIDASISEVGVDAAETVVIGDDHRDLQAAWRRGVVAALVRTGKGTHTEARVRGYNVPVFDDLRALAEAIADGTFRAGGREMMTVHQVFAEHAQVIANAAESLPDTLQRVALAAERCLSSGNKILACGNGGSAADAQHLVAELVGRFRDERRALAAITLMADSATLTALANDYGYPRVFARQVEALGRPGDLLFAISTSGNSPNVVEAAQTARRLGCTVVAMTGAQGGRLSEHADLLVRAPSTVVARIQEVHALSIHAIADALDGLLLSGEST